MGQGKSSINRKKRRKAKKAQQEWDRAHPSDDEEWDHFGMDDEEDRSGPRDEVEPGDIRRQISGTP